jgi:pyruvate dehydrogenase E2 component (dihydrolipoamide acetyltransferase)
MHALTLPRLGQTMETGRIVEWLLDEGAEYAEGTPVYAIETDKTVLEVQATLPGRLLKKLAAPDAELPVGEMVAVAADPGEQTDAAAIQRFIDGKGRGGEAATAPNERATIEPQAAREKSPSRAPRAMPRTKKLALELGVDLAAITDPTGPDGLITEDDVRRRSRSSVANSVAPATTEPQPTHARGTRRQRSAIEQTIARQMTRSWAVPQFSQDVEIDAEPLIARRQRLQREGIDVPFTSLLLDALVKALDQVPQCNATFDGDELVQFSEVDAAIALATPRGLLVPVLRDCKRDDIAARNQRLGELIGRARAGTLRPDEMSGGTVTLSNLGASRVETGTPILNAPQVCLVFTGAIVEKPVVRNGQLAVGKRMHVVSVYDHRVIDGVTGARFVDALTDALTAT